MDEPYLSLQEFQFSKAFEHNNSVHRKSSPIAWCWYILGSG